MPSEHDNTGLGAHEIGRIFREGSGRAVAALIRVFGDIDVAEDAVQDAFAIAMEKWPASGPPPNPTAWIITTARNRALDRLRRETLGRAILGDVVRDRLQEHEPDGESPDPLDDDLLRLIFTCCHPALAPDAQVALTLRLLGGLETAEVARAFLVQEATMAQRIVRAKRKIKESHIPYRVPEATDLPKRIHRCWPWSTSFLARAHTRPNKFIPRRATCAPKPFGSPACCANFCPGKWKPRDFCPFCYSTTRGNRRGSIRRAPSFSCVTNVAAIGTAFRLRRPAISCAIASLTIGPAPINSKPPSKPFTPMLRPPTTRIGPKSLPSTTNCWNKTKVPWWP